VLEYPLSIQEGLRPVNSTAADMDERPDHS
jgi:hypothetical protein